MGAGEVRNHALLSLAVLTPCFWQSRIHAGDLSSHVYNAWLAGLVQAGGVEGLEVVSLRTNWLFDAILETLLRYTTPDTTQRIAVALSVLMFVWGAFALLTAISGSKPWRVTPLLVILAYGIVFHMGFFNYYLSIALAFWALALGWSGTPARLIGAGALILLAAAAHGLGAVWGASLLAYTLVHRRCKRNGRWMLFGAALVGIAVVRALLTSRAWGPGQIVEGLVIPQLWCYGPKYYFLSLALAGVMLAAFMRLDDHGDWPPFAESILLQLTALSVAAVVILPSSIRFPWFQHNFVYVALRLGLPSSVLLCALMVRSPLRWERYALAAIGSIYFGMLFGDWRVFNQQEDALDRALSELRAGPPYARVVAALPRGPERQVNPYVHMIDRQCIGRCFSYANYEPSTRQFRVRVTGPNAAVAQTYADSYALQDGTYSVGARDLPLLQAERCREDAPDICLRPLRAGDIAGTPARNR